MSVTHIAGAVICTQGRTIQRCSLCGEKLVDSKGAMVETKYAGEPFPTWIMGRLVQIDGAVWTLLPETDKLPDDSCLELVEC
jgi:hypothetical protein